MSHNLEWDETLRFDVDDTIRVHAYGETDRVSLEIRHPNRHGLRVLRLTHDEAVQLGRTLQAASTIALRLPRTGGGS